MKKFLLLITLVISTFVFAATPSSNPESLKYSRQLLVVTTSDWNALNGQLQLYERKNDKDSWQAVGTPIAVVVGKHGLAWAATLPSNPAASIMKKEGDLRTPAGIFPLTSAFGFGPKYIKNIKLPYIQLVPNTVCVDDSQSQYYNRIINSSKIKKPDWSSSEQMRQIPEYMWGVEIAYNTHKPIAAGGSCTFLHSWRSADQGTAGCVAMAEPQVEKIITWLNPRKKPLIVILPKTVYETLEKPWQLPG